MLERYFGNQGCKTEYRAAIPWQFGVRGKLSRPSNLMAEGCPENEPHRASAKLQMTAIIISVASYLAASVPVVEIVKDHVNTKVPLNKVVCHAPVKTESQW